MFKRLTAVFLSVTMLLALVPTMALVGTVAAAPANNVIMPSNDGVTNNTTYILGEGTDAEVKVTCDFRDANTAPTGSITPKYIAIHNTGTYVSTANAYNTHRNTAKVSSDMAWHYTADNVGIYQALQDTRRGWHTGTSNSGVPANSNSIGIEMCVHNFPATETFDGELWNDGDAIMEWYVNQFDQTMKNTAYLALVLCKRWGLNWQTDIKQHYDALSYYPGGKDCPMQMRATYDPVTNTFKEAGGYVDGRDGYFWQIFWSYIEAYASGATTTGAVTNTTAEKLGTYVITPNDGLNIRTGPDATYEKVTALDKGTVVDVSEFSGKWGKICTVDGVEGWCNITDYGEYIGIDVLACDSEANTDAISASFDGSGRLTLINNSDDQGQFDLLMPFAIGTATTPYLSWSATVLKGDGFYFGLTQKGSSYFMMLDAKDSLKEGTTASYHATSSGEIDLREYWQPTDGYRINQLRLYLAPRAEIQLEYMYLATTSGKVVDPRYNLMATLGAVNLMNPADIIIGDPSKLGSYKYSNGMLIVTADTDAGFEVLFNLNDTFDINDMTRFLIDVQAKTDFNIAFLVTHAEGQGWVSLVEDYYPNFSDTKPANGFISPWTGTAGLDLYNYYKYNGIMPADNMSTVKQLKITLGSAGTSYFNAVQLAGNDRIRTMRDGVVKEGDTYPKQEKIILSSEVYTVREDGILSGVTAGSDIAAILGNVTSDYTVTVYENGVAVEGIVIAKTGQIVVIADGDETLATYAVAVRGDVNGDGKQATADVRAVLNSLTNEKLVGAYAVAADILESGEITSASARAILMETIA